MTWSSVSMNRKKHEPQSGRKKGGYRRRKGHLVSTFQHTTMSICNELRENNIPAKVVGDKSVKAQKKCVLVDQEKTEQTATVEVKQSKTTVSLLQQRFYCPQNQEHRSAL